MSTIEKLTRITQLTELKSLQALYRRDWPAHCVGYYCLDNFIRWLQLEPQIKNLQIFTWNNDWQSDGLFVIVDRYQLFVSSLKTSDNRLLKCLLEQLDWSGGYKVSSFLDWHREAVMHVIAEKQLELEWDGPTHLYYMPHEEAIKLEINCPTGYYLKPLSVENAELINSHWPNRHRASLFFIKRVIAWNVNMGVYDSNTNELVAWCVRLQGGFLGALQVRDSHKRLGLGTLVTAAISKKIAELEHDVMALVNPLNEPSCGMFEKLGFQIKDTCHWLRTKPTREGLLWPENE